MRPVRAAAAVLAFSLLRVAQADDPIQLPID